MFCYRIELVMLVTSKLLKRRDGRGCLVDSFKSFLSRREIKLLVS